MVSGLLVVFLGTRLAWQRWRALHNRNNLDHAPAHTHDHGDGHSHAHTHDHGDGHSHTHFPSPEGVRLSSLVAMGISGGLVPCLEALGIMVIAIGINRILLDLGLIVSFSIGLAAMLIVIGVLLVRSRSLLERFGGIGGRWSSILPLASAVIVTVLGVGITISAFVSYLGMA